MSKKLEDKFVWIVTARPNSDTVLVDRYKAKRIGASSVTVINGGIERCIRKSYGTHIFSEPNAAKKCAMDHLQARLESHEKAIKEIKEDLDGGVKYYDNPSAAVFSGKIKL